MLLPDRMHDVASNRVRGYGAALAAALLILLLAQVGEPLFGDRLPALPFVVPVVVAAWYGGLGPGLLATGAGAVMLTVTFFPGADQSWDVTGDDWIRLAALVLVGCMVSVLSESMHRAMRTSQATAEEATALAERLRQQALENARLLQEAERAAQQLRVQMTETEKARAEAQAANAAKAQFLATMSHELRTPLNAISGYTDLIEMGIHGPVTEAQREALRRVRRSASLLLALINDVLDFAKLEAGHVSFAPADMNLCEVVSELEQLIEPQVAAKGLQYVCVPCEHVVTAHADPEKVRQILLNLLSNAIKFTSAGGQIVVRCERADDVASVHVEDTGIGIPEDELDSVFLPFVQVRSDLISSSGGSGLGLAISRDLARAMGGDLTVASVEGTGSTFSLYVPARALP